MSTKTRSGTMTAEEAVSCVRSGARVFLHGGAATPHVLMNALVAKAPDLRNVEVVHLHTEGPAPWSQPEMADAFFVNALFVSGNMRDAVREGRADYTPVFLSEIPALFRQHIMPIDVALVHVSPPDRHGFCSLGVSVDVALAAVESATRVVAQVNPRHIRVGPDPESCAILGKHIGNPTESWFCLSQADLGP